MSGGGDPGYVLWHTVGVVGIVRELSTPSRRWHTDSENFLRGLRLVNKMSAYYLSFINLWLPIIAVSSYNLPQLGFAMCGL